MPVKHHIDHINRLIISDWKGAADVDQFIGAFLKYQKKIRNNPEYSSFDEVVNFRKMKGLKLSFHDLEKISDLTASFDDTKSTKLAFIVSTKLTYTLAKAHVIVRKLNPKGQKKLEVFFNEFDGLKWINRKS